MVVLQIYLPKLVKAAEKTGEREKKNDLEGK